MVTIDRLVPFQEIPESLTCRFAIFDDSVGRFREHCFKVVDVLDGGRWMITLERRFESSSEFVNIVSRLKSGF
jgi:hypothetical protein